jgi:hypothetical protein
MITLARLSLALLLSCGPPKSDSDCVRRCDDCKLRCVRSGGLVSSKDETCDEACDIDNDMWFCVVDAEECVVASGGE